MSGSSKALLMARLRARRRERGLVAVTVYVKPADREWLRTAVEKRGGECPGGRGK